MQLYLACGPEDDVPRHVTPVRADYRLDGDGALCALSLPRQMQGGLLLLTAYAGRCGDRTAQALTQECRRRRYSGVVVPFPAPALARALSRPLYRAGLELWLHERDAPAAPGCWVLVNTAQPRGSLQDRLTRAVRAFGQHLTDGHVRVRLHQQARAVLARAGDRQTDGAGGRKRQDRPLDRLAFLEREHDRVSGCSHL